MGNADKRRYGRLEQGFPVYFEIVSRDMPAPLPHPRRKGYAGNISAGGLFFITPITTGRTIKRLLRHVNKFSLELCLPDFQHRIRAFADIQWIKDKTKWRVLPRRWELGLRFIYIAPKDRDSIFKYVINKQIEERLSG